LRERRGGSEREYGVIPTYTCKHTLTHSHTLSHTFSLSLSHAHTHQPSKEGEISDADLERVLLRRGTEAPEYSGVGWELVDSVTSSFVQTAQ
jgi:hypothetical protein